MNPIENRRGDGPIRDYQDCARAIKELEALNALPMGSPERDDQYSDTLREVTDNYLAYCPENSIQAQPDRFLDYLLLFVKPMSIELASEETGVDLKALVNRHRDPSEAEAAILSRYFGVSADAFSPLVEAS